MCEKTLPNIVTGGLGQEGKKLGLQGKQARERRGGSDEEKTEGEKGKRKREKWRRR